MIEKDIFEPRVYIKPYEYPELLEYVDAIRHSYWLESEFNYTPDIQDMKVHMKPSDKVAVERTMLAISQIENQVKKFWGSVDTYLPKPEISSVGATFAESEVRHQDAYAELLKLLGLDEEFSKINDIPAMWDRLAYIDKVNSRTKQNEQDRKRFLEKLIFFSILIENVSLFSQFYIIMSFNKFDNMLKGMSNAIAATSLEEEIHANFGFEVVNLIKKENPNLWDDLLIERIYTMVDKAFKAEQKVLDWIYENGEPSCAPRIHVEEFIKNRLNKSLVSIGLESHFDIDEEILKETAWFDDSIICTTQADFFQKRNNTYTKRAKSITAEDLF